jgi:hypothetical protein
VQPDWSAKSSVPKSQEIINRYFPAGRMTVALPEVVISPLLFSNHILQSIKC